MRWNLWRSKSSWFWGLWWWKWTLYWLLRSRWRLYMFRRRFVYCFNLHFYLWRWTSKRKRNMWWWSPWLWRLFWWLSLSVRVLHMYLRRSRWTSLMLCLSINHIINLSLMSNSWRNQTSLINLKQFPTCYPNNSSSLNSDIIYNHSNCICQFRTISLYIPQCLASNQRNRFDRRYWKWLSCLLLAIRGKYRQRLGALWVSS